MYCSVSKCTLLISRYTVLYPSELFCILVYSTVLQCTVMYSTVSQCTVLWPGILYCIILVCTVLYPGALYCILLYSVKPLVMQPLLFWWTKVVCSVCNYVSIALIIFITRTHCPGLVRSPQVGWGHEIIKTWNVSVKILWKKRMGDFISAPTRARVPFKRVPVCPGAEAKVTFVWVRTDVWVGHMSGWRINWCIPHAGLGKSLSQEVKPPR